MWLHRQPLAGGKHMSTSLTRSAGAGQTLEATDAAEAGSPREARVNVGGRGLETVGIGSLVSLWREAGLRRFEVLDCHETGGVVRTDVDEPLDGERLASLAYVDRWSRVAESERGLVYVVEFTAPAFPPSLAERAEHLIGARNSALTDHGFELSLIGSQEAIAAVVREYESLGMNPDLRQLGPYEPRDRPLDALTDRQLEVLRTAYAMGYYEVPRTVSTADVAEELGIDASTVSEHLRRAERNVLVRYLNVDPHASR